MTGKQGLFVVTIVILMGLLILMTYLEDDNKRGFKLLYQLSAPSSKHPVNSLLEDPLTESTKDYETEANSVTVPTKDYLTEEEALRGRPLTDIKETVSVELSTVKLMDNRTIYKVGEEITLFITLRNGYNVSRSQGGDHLRVRIFNEVSKAYASGHVLDHTNGSYTAIVRAIWPGKQTVSLALVYRRETIRAMYYIRQKEKPLPCADRYRPIKYDVTRSIQFNRLVLKLISFIEVDTREPDYRSDNGCVQFFHTGHGNYFGNLTNFIYDCLSNITWTLSGTRITVAGFSYKTYEEATRCHPDRSWLTNYTTVCNFTLRNGGASWYCGKPKNPILLCEDWTFVKQETPYPKLPITDVENQLLGTKKSMFPDISIDVTGQMADRRNLPQCSSYPKQDLWKTIQPTGYFYKDIWYLHHCKGSSTKDFKHCLRDSHLMISGDSTTRQWYSYLLPYLSCEPTTETWTKSTWHKRSACRIPSINFTMEWLPHGQPFSVGNWFEVNRYTLNAESNQIDEIKSDVKVIYVIHMFMHKLGYHHSVFTDRMRRISRSIKLLLERNKHAKVLIKGPHTFTFANVGVGRLNDYFGFLYRDIMYEEFKGLRDKIIYMDQKDMTIAKAIEPQHPSREVVEQTVRQMLNYICD